MKNWRKAVIGPDTPIIEAIRLINEHATQFAVVASEGGRVLGTVTDGDLRRGILQRVDLDAPVEKIMNANPTTIRETEGRISARRLMEQRSFTRLPVVNGDGKLVNVLGIEELAMTVDRPNPVVIMAGGLGTRLHPLTADTPKPMIPVQGRPILEYLIEQLAAQGFRKVHIAVNYLSGIIEDHFRTGERWGVEISYLSEQEPMGTGGALSLLSERPDCSTLVMNGDIMSRIDLTNLIETHDARGSDMTVCVVQYEHEIPYGVINADQERLVSIEEKPKDRHLVSAGVYALSPCVFDLIPGGRMDMPDLIRSCLSKTLSVDVFAIHEYWRDIGRKADLERVEMELQDTDK